MKYNVASIIHEKLDSLIVNPKSELNFTNNFELLIAVMLSAQCTDKRVNLVTENLFKKYRTPKDFSLLKIEDLENMIKSCNYFRNKAKYIILSSNGL